ncbi:MAG TPA: HDOD domain-containing protein [Cellvibrio sp.]|nr:HDOD domain-containing protein [Cellvibrio sp.]
MNIQNLIDNAQKLPNIPKVVQELIESFGDDEVSNNEIAQKISADQVLTIKVLRAANSAHYGGNRKIGSVSDAVFLLGFNAVRTLVLASGLTGAFKAPEGFDIRKFWHDSFAVAAVCKWVAKFSRDDMETAFTCGMIHNIGELLIHIIMPAECAEIEKNRNGDNNNSAIEKKYLGFDFADAGAELASRWKFPEAIVQGIRYQLTPYEAEKFPRLAGVIHIALYLNKMNEEGADTEAILAGFPHEVATSLNINIGKLIEKIEEIKELSSPIDELLE